MPEVPTIKRRVGTAPLRLEQPAPETEVDLSGVGELGKLTEQIFQEEVAKANQVAVLDADLALSQAETELFNAPEGALNARGKDATAIYDPTMEAYDKTVSEISSGLNEAQALTFRNLSQGRRKTANKQLLNHISNEAFEFDTATTTALLTNEQARIADNYGDEVAISESIAKQTAILKDYAKRNGQGKEVTDQKVRDNTSNNHKAIINRMLADGNDVLASEYFNDNDSFIFDDNKLRTKLTTASRDGEASRMATDIWGTTGPKTDIDPVELDKLVNEARKQSKGDTDLFDTIVADLTQRGNLHNSSADERTRANNSAVWGAYDEGNSVTTITQMKEYQDLSETDQVKIKNNIIASEKRKTAVDKEALVIEQTLNHSALMENLPLLREVNASGELDAMLVTRELSPIQHRSLKKILDPKKTPTAKASFKTLDDMKTKRLFSRNKEENIKEWAEATELLHGFIENNPDKDPLEFVERMNAEVGRRAVGWTLDKFKFGAPALEQAEQEKREALELEAGIEPREEEDITGLPTSTNPTTGEKMIFKDGSWQKL